MSPHSNPSNPLHVDDPEGDPPCVSANRLTPDSAAAYHPATRHTINKPTRPEAACMCSVPVHIVLVRGVNPPGLWVKA